MRPASKPQPNLTPIDDLDRNILNLCTHINAATYELLVLIREFDERAGFLQWGLQNCAEWLAWRCDLSMTTALEKVRVAHALKTLPAISAAFGAGELSYSKVRALTRVACRDNEHARHGNAGGPASVCGCDRGHDQYTGYGDTEHCWHNRFCCCDPGNNQHA